MATQLMALLRQLTESVLALEDPQVSEKPASQELADRLEHLESTGEIAPKTLSGLARRIARARFGHHKIPPQEKDPVGKVLLLLRGTTQGAEQELRSACEAEKIAVRHREQAMKRARASGSTISDIAAIAGLSRPTVYKVLGEQK